MNAIAPIRPQPIVTETFEVFALTAVGRMIPLDTAGDLPAAIEIGCMRSAHKDQFAVRQFGTRSGNVTLLIYQVRRGKPALVFRGHAYHREARQFADLIATVQL